ncbi:MAG: glycosyltransferase family 39 protein [Deltaproteobacteria bacterium]|nr:glycosyltransferase family 39 protein [Deltaproteobacteria bacterium]
MIGKILRKLKLKDVLKILIALQCVVVFILASVPPISRDALTHHLIIPKLFINHGGIYNIPEIVFSYYPMNLDLIYMIPLYFGNDIIPKYIHFSFALFTAFLIFFYLKKRIDSNFGLLGALFFLSIPVIVKLSINVYVDLGLIFFSTTALLCLFKWVESEFIPKHLIFSAICCGLALGTKYNGLIVFFILSCIVPFAYLRRSNDELFKIKLGNQFKAIGCGLIFVFISLLVFSPWMIKNYILTQNPVYPLYNSWFNPKGILTNDNRELNVFEKTDKKDEWSHFAVRKIVYRETLWQIASIPVRIFFEGMDDDPKHFDGQLNPFLLLLALFAFFPGQTNPKKMYVTENKILFMFSILYLFFVFFQVDMRIRWVGPIIPPMVILSMFGLERIQRFGAGSERKKILFNSTATIIVSGMLLLNARYIHALYLKVDPVPYISGQIDRDNYIKKFRPEYEVIRYANQHLPENALILGLFIGNRRYYFEKKVLLDVDLLKRAVLSSNSSGQIRKKLVSVGITHILMRYDLFNNWTEYNLAPENQILLNTFLSNRAKQLKSYGGYGLFELM